MTADELAEFFQLIGKAIWFLQNVEKALTTSILLKGIVKERGAVTMDVVRSHESQLGLLTLGVAIKRARKHLIFNEEVFGRLEIFLEERNWLVHRCANENAEDLFDEASRLNLFDRIEAFAAEAHFLQHWICKDLTEYTISKGVSETWIEQETQKSLAKLLGKGL